MQRSPVSSSNIASVGYDSFYSILEVEFKTGAVYRYFEVPHSVFQELIHASSVGRYLNKNIAFDYKYENTENVFKDQFRVNLPKFKNPRISKNDSLENIRSLYYKLAHRFHPDRDPQSEDIMKKINALYRENDFEGLKRIALKYQSHDN